MKRFLFVVVPVFILSSCATYYHLTPTTLTPSQKVYYVQGYESVSDGHYAAKDSGLMINIFGFTTNDVLRLEVYYQNDTAEPIDAIPDRIKVEGVADDGSQKAVKVWEANSYVRKIDSQQRAALIISAIAGAFSAVNAGTSTTTTYGTYNGHSSYGSYRGSYYSQSQTYDPSKVAEANALNAAAIQSQANENERNIAYLTSVLLKRTTLMPKFHAAGAVFCDKDIYPGYIITVPFGGTDFVIHFKLVKDE